MNRYPLWKYLLLIVTLIVGLIYALPNLYPSDPSVQISQRQGNDLEPALMQSLEKTLNEHQLGFKSSELNGPNALIRFDDTETQLEASDLIRETLGREYVVALNLAPATPAWLQALNALFQRYDFLVLPTAQVFPFDARQPWPKDVAGRTMDTYHRWMEVVIGPTLAGVPTISVPAGFGPTGLPMGLQIMGPSRQDMAVLQIARAWEQATDYAGHRSPLLR